MNYRNDDGGGDGEVGKGPIIQHLIRILALALGGQKRVGGIGADDRFTHENHSGCHAESILDAPEWMGGEGDPTGFLLAILQP